MIVLGADTHKRSHTLAAVDAATGQVLGDKTVAVGARGFAALVVWARGLDGERVWALEDCRHVSGALERFLIGRGERVVRVSTRLMAGTPALEPRAREVRSDRRGLGRARRAGGRDRDAADRGVGRPRARHPLLVDHRERLVRTRVALNSTLQWNLHDLWPELDAARAARCSRRSGATQDRPAPGARRADDARADRPRRAAPPARADPRRSTRSRPRSPTSSPRSRRSCSPSPGSGR